MKAMKVFLMPNMSRRNVPPALSLAVPILRKAGIVPVLDPALPEEVPGLPVEFAAFESCAGECSAVIAIGGDGTILHAAKAAVEKGLPVLGINGGRVGYLAGLELSELGQLARLAREDYEVEHRMMLCVSTGAGEGQKTFYALNDAVVARGAPGNLIDIELCCEGTPLCRYRSDGVIFSTPTGSTAYALSAGGPIVDPAVSAIGVTPICPHSPLDRTILFAPQKQLSARGWGGEGRPVVLTCDGEEGVLLEAGAEVTVCRASRTVELIRFGQKNFYHILNQKIMGRGFGHEV